MQLQILITSMYEAEIKFALYISTEFTGEVEL
jgi:hypothetical protein